MELEYRYFKAFIFLKLKRIEESINLLNSLISEDEARYGKAYFDLAGIYAKQNRIKETISVLKKAEKVDRERALLHQGYTYLNSNKPNKAIKIFMEVRKDQIFKQQAIFSLGKAYYMKMDYKKGLTFADEAIRINPETGVAQNAKFLMEMIRREMKLRKRFSVLFSSTNQYDDNVILQPLEQAGLQKIGIPPSEQKDYSELVVLKAGYKPIMRRNATINIEATFIQSFYLKLKANQITAFFPTLRYNYNMFPLVLAFSYTFGHILADRKPYADIHTIAPVLILNEGQHARSELMFQTDIRRYLDGVTPHADHHTLSYSQYVKISKIGEIRFGYRYEIEDNKKNIGDFIGQEMYYGLVAPFIFNTSLILNYSYIIRDFKFSEAISLTQKRKDIQHLVYVVLRRRFGKYLDANLMYVYTNSDSNLNVSIQKITGFDPYKWRKNVVSFSFSVSL